jgi:3-oxoacyl-(acyl-carrier-protein) synthase
MDSNAATLTTLIQTCIKNSAIEPMDVAVVMLSGTGIATQDQTELRAVTNIFNKECQPKLATTATRWGNMMEAGGAAEIGFLRSVFQTKSLPESAVIGPGNDTSLDQNKSHALILRSSPSGEYTCMVVRMEDA